MLVLTLVRHRGFWYLVGMWCLGFSLVILPIYLTNPLDIIIPRVENSTLYSMDFDASTSTLTYNISAVYSFFYPNLMRMRFSKLVETPVYHGQILGDGDKSPSFRMRKGWTMQVRMDAQGQQVVGDKHTTAVAMAYQEEVDRGYFRVDGRVQVDQNVVTEYFVCALYYPAPTAWPGGAPNMFDGVECMNVHPLNDDSNPFSD